MKQRIYIDTSIVGRFFDKEFAEPTINKVDILASWNFKHIININRIRGYNGVNLKKGYATLEIRNPRELIDYEN
jgi:hypothetical protein